MKQNRGSRCEQCDRPTEFLFVGVVKEKVVTKWRRRRDRWLGYQKVPAVVKAITREGLVCFRCRPPSNLEIRELLKGNR